MLFSLITQRATRERNGGHGDRAAPPDREVVAAILAGDEGAFARLYQRYWAGMVRVAKGLVRSDTVAAEVVQETWETVFKELAGFRGEAALKTWIYRILINRARRVGQREARSTPFSELARADAESRWQPAEDEFTAKGHWRSPVHGWRMIDPQDEAITRQGVELLGRELERLPQTQRVVVTMRDVEGLDAKDVCELLDISEGNQRVLLHRGRTALRLALAAAERGSAAGEGA